MKITSTCIPDVKIIEPAIFRDKRGFFFETWQQTRFDNEIVPRSFVQDNLSGSIKGTLRGLHYQASAPQGKLVQVIVGEVFDVAVDIRKNSTTFGKWVGEVLSAENRKQLWIPEGFAHGFYVISKWAEFTYKCTDFYNPGSEQTIIWNDPDIGIKWPTPEGEQPIVSEKDSAGRLFKDAVYFE